MVTEVQHAKFFTLSTKETQNSRAEAEQRQLIPNRGDSGMGGGSGRRFATRRLFVYRSSIIWYCRLDTSRRTPTRVKRQLVV